MEEVIHLARAAPKRWRNASAGVGAAISQLCCLWMRYRSMSPSESGRKTRSDAARDAVSGGERGKNFLPPRHTPGDRDHTDPPPVEPPVFIAGAPAGPRRAVLRPPDTDGLLSGLSMQTCSRKSARSRRSACRRRPFGEKRLRVDPRLSMDTRVNRGSFVPFQHPMLEF